MPAWSNTDAPATKPKMDVERQTRDIRQLVTANTTNAGNNTITFTYADGGQSNVANVGVAVGQYVYAAGLSANGYAGFFKSNNTVASLSSNNVTFVSPVFVAIPAGVVVEFDGGIVYNANKPVEVTYNADTILITDTRNANTTNAQGSIANTGYGLGNFSTGWVHVQKKVNNDGTVRYLKETLVCLTNASASNTGSAAASFGQVVTGL